MRISSSGGWNMVKIGKTSSITSTYSDKKVQPISKASFRDCLQKDDTVFLIKKPSKTSQISILVYTVSIFNKRGECYVKE